MKKVIISALTILLTGCSTPFLDSIEKPLVTEDNYWKTPCFVTGVTLNKPWLKKEKYGYGR